jgi:hypothetical protein
VPAATGRFLWQPVSARFKKEVCSRPPPLPAAARPIDTARMYRLAGQEPPDTARPGETTKNLPQNEEWKNSSRETRQQGSIGQIVLAPDRVFFQ